MEQITAPSLAHDAALSRAARAVLRWSLMDASERAGVSIASVLAAEGKGAGSASPAALDRLRRTYEEAGVLFSEGRSGRGIRILFR